MDATFLQEVKRYVAFSAEDARLLAGLAPLLEAHATEVIDHFYDVILEHPRASRAITGGAEQVERLKKTLRGWLIELADGEYGDDYLARRAAIGRRHVVIDLPHVFMVTAMDVVRRQLAAIIRAEMASDSAKRDRVLEAMHKILDIDLAIMLETYEEDSLEKVRRSERRAMIGELAARVNHELRTRLGTIKSSAFLLEKLLADAPESVTKHVRRVQWGAERAGATLGALLDLARELKPQVTLAELNHIVREAVAGITKPAEVTVVLDLARESPRVRVDPELFVGVVANLIQNAIDAQASTGGRVEVRTRQEDGAVLLTVADEGIGLSPQVMEHLFEPFFTTKPNGSGLGLAIANEIVRAHGGTIDARGRTDGQGAEFVVSLSAAAPRKGGDAEASAAAVPAETEERAP